MINVIKHISRDLPVVPGCAGLCRVVSGCAGMRRVRRVRRVWRGIRTYIRTAHGTCSYIRTQNAQETYAFVHLNSLKSVYFAMFSISKTSSKDWMGLNTFEPILFRACQEKG